MNPEAHYYLCPSKGLQKSMGLLAGRIVNGLVPIQVHCGPGTGTVKEKVELERDPKPFWNRFIGSGIGSRTIYGMSLDPGLGRE